MLELGSNCIIDEKWGIDVNIQYNIIPGLEKPQISGTDNNSDEDSNLIELSTISKKVDADYIAINFGVIIAIHRSNSD